jgi:hypothetical protein
MISSDAFAAIIEAYQEKFGELPSLAGLGEVQLQRAAVLLQEAVELDVPYQDTADFFEALGMEMPPDDALT